MDSSGRAAKCVSNRRAWHPRMQEPSAAGSKNVCVRLWRMTTRRLYYDDSYLQNFEGRVISCLPAEPVHGSSGTQAAWEVLLDQTAFYPTSGGQPNDSGLLGEAVVLEVRDEEDEIVHIVDREVELGVVNGCVNWPRRFDHMQQHTGQHLLSAMFQERFGLPTVSFHLGGEICTIDLRGPEPSAEVLEGAERAANRIVFEDRPVNVRYDTAEELARLGVRKEVDRKGILRAIEIESADLQPCGGTHVKSTGQVGLVLVRRCTKIRQDWRIEFVCGGRAARVARHDYLLLREVAEKLSCAPEEVVSSAARSVAERDANFKTLRVTFERLAEAEAALALQSTAPGPDGLRIVSRVLDEGSPEYLGFYATAVAKAEKTVALLAAKESGQLLFAQHPSAGLDMNTLLKKVQEKL